MLEIIRLGENTTHDANFEVNRPFGHPHYLLLLVKTPACFFVNEQWKHTPAHCALLFKPKQQHLYHADKDIYIDDWLHFQSSQEVTNKHFPFGVPIPLHNPNDYYNLFHLINNEFFGSASQRTMILHHLSMALIDKISDESKTQEYPAIYYSLISLRENIYRYPEKNWNIPDMAADLNISTGYLHALYQEFFQTTCINDVIQSRIQTACDLLTSTSKPVNEVATLCGYQNIEHFMRQFKSLMNTTPGKYRKQIL